MLSEIDFRVLNQLADDDEDLSSIVRMLKREIDDPDIKKNVEGAIVRFIHDDLCSSIEVVELDGRSFGQVTRIFSVAKIEEYWYRITDKGKKELSKPCYDRVYNDPTDFGPKAPVQ
jgi:hypothetical protein